MVSKSQPPTVEFDADKSHIKMTAVRFVALMAAVVVLSNMVSNKISAMASDDDVEAAVATHSVHPHPSTESRLAKAEGKDAAQDAQLAKLEDVPVQVGDINAKLDTLILRELERPGRNRDDMRGAAAKVRFKRRVRAGATDDPLAGLDGL